MGKNFSPPMLKASPMKNKKILILTTGGTIAGSGENSLLGSNYRAGTISGEAILNSIPPMQEHLDVQEIAQIDSIEIHEGIWNALLKTLKDKFQDYDGFIVTHGTDTMEESAFVIDLLYHGSKPVVFVGAMRPSNAIGSDGIKNLCNAIALASNSTSQGVMVLINDKVYNPQTIYKSHTHNLDAFASRNSGTMGYVLDGEARFFYHRTKVSLPFKDLKSLPRVEIVYIYAGMETLPSFSPKPQGLVIMGCGAGNIPSKIKAELAKFQAQGIQIVACSRGNEGFILKSEFIPSYGLSAPKARILLALCLKHLFNTSQIQETFALF